MSEKKVNDVSLDDESTELDLVQLDGLVVLKIIKHCQEMLPDLVTGQLLGLDISKTVEVTNCFPFPAKVAEENEEDIEAEAQVSQEYQIEMMRCLREVNVDDNTVGWYSSTYMESFFNESTIETQYAYQERIKKSVMIIYDPLKTAQGFLSLRAYRLTQPFMSLFAEGTFTKDSLAKAGLSFSDVFEEIPIKITNSNLIKAFLLELEESGRVESDFERLDLSTNPMLEKNLETICDCLDDLAQEQNKFQYYQRNLQKQITQRTAWLQKRRTENAQRKTAGQELLPEEDPTNPIFKPIPEPSRLDSLLLTNQVNNYCREMNRFSSNSLTKLFLTTHLNNPQ